MIAVLDAHYDEDTLAAVGAAVVFSHWNDSTSAAEYTADCQRAESYVPGEFYKRELPCLLAVLKQIVEPLDTIVIDGYVSLGDKPGLGMRLWEALERKTPVIGVAKTRFRTADAVEVNRGTSKQPLYITAVGTDQEQAGANIAMMAGPHRVPTLLKRVDQLARRRLLEVLGKPPAV
jgi:Deoxyinosine 3''endonuclease (endonuclease V)